ncbi:MAG TPA: HAD hydrolase family protein [Candidatus Limnocylindrales bacterium]|nr:HAD hydrolase family protein [Candidatus Limnocylindrales bacterium]
MIKAIITDVDGVIIGEKIGYNSPHPHSAVLSALKDIRGKGIPVALCTAKPYYAILDIIKDAPN